MKRITAPLLALLALAPFAAANLEEHLPAGTFGLIKVDNIEQSRARLDAHPVAKGPGADRFKQFIGPLIDKLRAKDEKAFTEFEQIRDSALKHFKGEFVWAVVRTPDPLPGHQPFDLVTLADTTADEATLHEFFKDTKLFQPTPPEAEPPAGAKSAAPTPQSEEAEEDEAMDDTQPAAGRRTPKIVLPKLEAVEEEFAGVKLHLLTTKVDDKPVGLGGWALIDKTFIYATAPNVLKELVESRKSGRKDAFTDTALFKSNKEALADRDMWMLFNMPLIATAAREQLVGYLDAEKKAGHAPLGGGMFDALKTYDSMAFDNITQLHLALSLKPRDTRVDTSITWKERKGIVNLMQYREEAAPETFLAPADAVSMDAGRLELSGMLATFESMLREAFPFASPMLDLQLDKMKNEEGLDIRSAVLGNFGDSVVSITGESPTGPATADADAMPQVWVIALKDQTKLESFIETIIGKVSATQTGDGKKALFDEREILGVKVRDIKTESASAPRFAYALHKNRLLLSKGDPALLNKVIGQLVAPKPGLDATPAHQAGLAKLPAGGCVISHSDLGKLMNLVSQQMILAVQRKAAFGNTSGEALEALDLSKAPRAEDFPFVIVGKSYASPTGIESHAVLVPKSGDETK